VTIIVTGDPDEVLKRIDEAIGEQSTDGPAVMKFSMTDESVLNLTKAAFEAILGAGTGVEVVSGDSTMSLSEEVLGTLSGKEDVSIDFRGSAADRMNAAQRDAAGPDATVVELRICSGGESLGNSLNGTLSVTVKHEAAEGKIPVAYYIDEQGGKQDMHGTYDAAKGEMSFVTTHCSIYAVVDEAPASSDADDAPSGEDDGPAGEGGDNTLLYIGAAIAAVVLIAVAAVLISRRSRTTFP